MSDAMTEDLGKLHQSQLNQAQEELQAIKNKEGDLVSQKKELDL